MLRIAAGPFLWKITGAKFLDGICFLHAKLSPLSYSRWVLFFPVNLLVHILAQPEHSFWINLNTYSDLT